MAFGGPSSVQPDYAQVWRCDSLRSAMDLGGVIVVLSTASPGKGDAMRIRPSSVRLVLAAVHFSLASTASAVAIDGIRVGNPGNATDPDLSTNSCGFSNDFFLNEEI